jgi:signal transduction histidine kinase/ActR/RegA family two-component response regulator
VFANSVERTDEDAEVAVVEGMVEGLARTVERRLARRKLESAARQLEVALGEAREASQAKSHFLANMSHEIRTPMTAIIGYADVLARQKNDPESLAELTALLRVHAGYLLDLVNDILDLSKIEAKEIEIRPTRCDIRSLLSRVVSLMRYRAMDKRLDLEVHCGSRFPSALFVDELRVRQILINLVSNAIKFTDRGGVTVNVEFRPDEAGLRCRALFEVIDTGNGIDPAIVDRLFEPFVQGRTSGPTPERGTGLGLAISQSLARLLGGDIRVDSRAGEGSCFTFEFDAGPAGETAWLDPGEFELNEQPSSVVGSSSDDLRGMRVHVVDDNPDNLKIIQFLLEETGVEVSCSRNGEECIQAVKSAVAEGNPHALVLMDMMMPVMDGYTATTQLRNEGIDIPIVALTAFAMAGDREKCIDVGCNDYLTKPIIPAQLEEVLARYRPEPGDGTGAGVAADAAPIRSDRADDPSFAPLLQSFLKGLGATLTDLEQALQEADRKRLAVLVHRLRGTAGSYGLGEVSTAAGVCEDALRGGADWDDVVPLARDVRAVVRRCLD